jgi:hypothetical protein
VRMRPFAKSEASESRSVTTFSLPPSMVWTTTNPFEAVIETSIGFSKLGPLLYEVIAHQSEFALLIIDRRFVVE